MRYALRHTDRIRAKLGHKFLDTLLKDLQGFFKGTDDSTIESMIQKDDTGREWLDVGTHRMVVIERLYDTIRLAYYGERNQK